jgi:hypothetical protein
VRREVYNGAWIEENEISVNTYKRLVESFLKAGILYDDSVISSLDKSRNYSYLSAYDSSIYANKLIEYLKNITSGAQKTFYN